MFDNYGNLIVTQISNTNYVTPTAILSSTIDYDLSEQFGFLVYKENADGNWYVEVKKIDPNAPAIFIYEVPVIAENYNSKFTSTANFFNEASADRTKTVRGFVLGVTDVYELSEDAFDGTPVAGAKVTISGQKHVVATA
jgi:hypothetical protein